MTPHMILLVFGCPLLGVAAWIPVKDAHLG